MAGPAHQETRRRAVAGKTWMAGSSPAVRWRVSAAVLTQDFDRLLHDRRWGLIDLGDELLHRVASDRRDLELRLFGFGEEVLVLHRVHERLAQRIDAVLRYAGRRQIGTPE